MPRRVPHRLHWSSEEQTYQIHNESTSRGLPAESDAWSGWLAAITSFSFLGRSGAYCTARREKMQRGDAYWYAYRSIRGKTVKRYIGKTDELTISRLEEIAASFATREAPVTSIESDEARINPSVSIASVQPNTSTPLLEPKFNPPRLPPLLVERPRLFNQLGAGLSHKLTLIMAPAGFGKTTLVNQWLARQNKAMAWISLDSSENDPVRFWRYIITACQRLRPGLGDEALALLSAKGQNPFVRPSLETALTFLLNDLTLLPESVLVLDDYHVIKEQRVHEMLATFLEHLPTTVHILLLSRSEPPLLLARWRARGELYDISVNDLRFSHQETADFLHQALAYTPSAETIVNLDDYIEGWAAGLRLLALALRNQRSQRGIEQQALNLTGGQRSIRDYFVSEILASQAEPTQRFLLQTSVLSRLSGSLCKALTGREESAALLEEMEQTGLFLEALTGSAHEGEIWYRYYPLFAEAMQAEARRRLGGNELRTLSLKASQWFEQHEMPIDAITASLRSQEFERAIDLIEKIIEEQWYSGGGGTHGFVSSEFHTLCRWIEQLPEAMLARHPSISFAYANALLYTFVLDERPLTAETMQRINTSLQIAEDDWRSTGNMALLGEVFAFRALMARQYGATAESVKLANQALEYMSEESKNWRTLCLSVLASGVLASGQLNLARQLFQPGRPFMDGSMGRAIARAGMVLFSRIGIEQLEFRQTEAFLHRMLIEAREDKDHDDMADALLGLSQIAYARNELAEAAQQAQEALELGKQIGNEETIVHAALVLIKIEFVREGAVPALQQLLDLLSWVQPDGVPLRLWLVREVQAQRARLYLASGDLGAVERWMGDRSQPDDALPTIQREREELLIARLLLAQDRVEDAMELLARLLNGARSEGRIRNMLEIQMLTALAHASRKRMHEAKSLLQEVIARACPEGYQRLFLDAGEEIVPLLQAALPGMHGEMQISFVRGLLHALTRDQTGMLATEPLSAQELRVLRLLVAGRSNPEIAQELVVSINTVKSQVQNIYRKLNVNNRVEASEVARHLRLL